MRFFRYDEASLDAASYFFMGVNSWLLCPQTRFLFVRCHPERDPTFYNTYPGTLHFTGMAYLPLPVCIESSNRACERATSGM